MEFNGFVNMDFDFFKKKCKMSKEDYENGRKNLKTHFRGLCYEIQKLYYKEFSIPFYVEKEFQNFNKRSTSISALHNIENSCFKLNLELNENGVLSVIVVSSDAPILDILKNNKKEILNFITAGKNGILYANLNLKAKNTNIIKFNSYEISDKNYDIFYKGLAESIKDGKNVMLYIGCFYNKPECIKQGKTFIKTSYNSVVEALNLARKLK